MLCLQFWFCFIHKLLDSVLTNIGVTLQNLVSRRKTFRCFGVRLQGCKGTSSQHMQMILFLLFGNGNAIWKMSSLDHAKKRVTQYLSSCYNRKWNLEEERRKRGEMGVQLHLVCIYINMIINSLTSISLYPHEKIKLND